MVRACRPAVQSRAAGGGALGDVTLKGAGLPARGPGGAAPVGEALGTIGV